eukprot:TRINITY_DN12413_c0_g1_i7.p1 TRINITY_DN12413_c0_g1~~TRINITY_DN12413_c0_g1_i7.p1  ORF type:complete len:391 (+),score=26.94 TRINITY_DN12413_c0_g1_i7:89-1174(+)
MPNGSGSRGRGSAEAGRGTAQKGGEVLGYSAAKGKGRGAAAAAGEQRSGAAAALAAVCAYDPATRSVAAVPELAAALPVADASLSSTHTALVDPRGAALCCGSNEWGELGVSDRRPRQGLASALLPWPAAAVRCGSFFSVALRRGGTALCSWGGSIRSFSGPRRRRQRAYRGARAAAGGPNGSARCGPTERNRHHSERRGLRLGRQHLRAARSRCTHPCGVHSHPHPGAELPRAVAHSLWGSCLSRRNQRQRELLCWEHLHSSPPVPLRARHGRVAFPLRSLAASCTAAVADAHGRLWCVWDAGQCQDGLHCGGLPAGERAVRVAPISGIGMGKEGVFVVATAAGRLWDCRKDTCAEWPGV